MYVALIRKFTRTAEGGVYGGCNVRIIFGLEKYDIVREKSGKSQGIFYCLAAGNLVRSLICGFSHGTKAQRVEVTLYVYERQHTVGHMSVIIQIDPGFIYV